MEKNTNYRWSRLHWIDFSDSFSQQRVKITIFDNFLYNQTSLLDICYKNNLHIVNGDVRIIIRLIEIKSDIIIPLAALVGAPMCKNPKGSEDINKIQF